MSPRMALVCWLVLAAAGWGMVIGPTWVAVEHGPTVVAWMFNDSPDAADPSLNRMFADDGLMDEDLIEEVERAVKIKPAAGAVPPPVQQTGEN